MKNRSYLYVKAFSDLGSRMDVIALGAVIYSVTQSAGWLSALLGVSVLGGMLSSLFSGILADRMDRRILMIISDLLRAALIAALDFFPNAAIILLVRFLIGVCSSFFEVSFMAEVPQIYGSTQMLRVNALLSRLSSISMVLGFLGGGIIYDQIGYEAVLLIDGLTFLVSAVVLMRMRWEVSLPSDNQPKPSLKQPIRSMIVDLRESKAYLLTQPAILIVFLVFLFDSFGSASHNIGVPILAEWIDGERQAFYYGLLWSAWALGNVLTTYILPKIAFIRKELYWTNFISTVFMSLGFMAFLSTANLLLVLPFAFLTGLADAFAMTTNATIMQQCDNRVRGRIFGVAGLLSKLGFSVGFIVAPLLLERLQLTHMVWAMHGMVIVVAIAGICLYGVYASRRNRRAESNESL